jgi:adenylate kinase family enzyme
VAAGAAAVGPAALAPLAVLAPIWGWVDQKNEAVQLLADLVNAFKGRVAHATTQERRQLVRAAHTAVVISAFFESVREHLGPEVFATLELTEEEKLALVRDSGGQAHTNVIRQLYAAEVPVPSPTLGFEENVKAVGEWLTALATKAQTFFEGLASWPHGVNLLGVVDPAVARYRDHYVALAAAAPEFRIWAELAEHSATRHEVIEIGDRLQTALLLQRDDLRRVEALLTLTAGRANAQSEPQTVVQRSNSARLEQLIIKREEAEHLGAVNLPTVGTAFVMPSYRLARMHTRSRVADETWWTEQDKNHELDLWLAAYALSADATRFPLLLLGHPGAGKSMLVKVLAARLPASDYTVALVPLRTVSANAPILEQIQQALDQSTNRRVDWSQLADRSIDTVRVVILDGLDELLQASSTDRSGFLQEVMAFQRIEAEQERPVIVIVTSRTVVADRVDIPTGTAVLKLEDFEKNQIDRWLQVWNEANASPIRAGLVRPLPTEIALSQPMLASQPLLLLMLALYSADPGNAPLDVGLSQTKLYQRIFENFARREVLKGGSVSGNKLQEKVELQLSRLCVAALAMFNRGRQSVSEEELTADLAALHGRDWDGSDEPGQRVLGEFFFVHTAEATVLGADSEDGGTAADSSYKRKAKRSYEFLHATFGEYLVAYRSLEELRDIADRAFSGRRARDPEDGFLFAILSHQPLAGRRSTLSFLRDLFESLETSERTNITEALNILIRNYRHRPGVENYGRYEPLQMDSLRQIAAYSANLVSVRLAVASGDGAIRLSDIEPIGSRDQWAATLNLWKAGLGVDGWHALIGSMSRSGDHLSTSKGRRKFEITPLTADLLQAELAEDTGLHKRLKVGLALSDAVFVEDDADPTGSLIAKLYADTVGFSSPLAEPGADGDDHKRRESRDPTQIDEELAFDVVSLIERLLAGRQARPDLMTELLVIVDSLGYLEDFDPTVLFLNICRFPEVLARLPRLSDPALFDDPTAALLLARCIKPTRGPRLAEGKDEEQAQRRVETKWRSLLLALASRSEDADALISQLPEEIVSSIARIVFSLRDDRWSEGSQEVTGNRSLRSQFPRHEIIESRRALSNDRERPTRRRPQRKVARRRPQRETSDGADAARTEGPPSKDTLDQKP